MKLLRLTGSYLVLLVLFCFLGACTEKQITVEENTIVNTAPPKIGYKLKFGADFNANLNYVDELGISIVIIMDCSGSMADSPDLGGEVKYRQASKALDTVLQYLAALSKSQKDLVINVAILRFSNDVREVLPLTRLDETGIKKLDGIANPKNFTPQGGTAIGLALEKGSEILAQSGTIFNSLVIVSDGENTISPKPEDVIKGIYSNNNNKAAGDFPVRTSTQLLSIIGFDLAASQFERFHELGARIMSAENQSELESSLRTLLEADITKLEDN